MVKINLNETKLQKNRFGKNPKFKNLNFGDAGFLIIKEGRLELIHLLFLKRLVKKLFIVKKNVITIPSTKAWFNIKPNFIIQKKSKNSRMGKGKGMFERKIIKIFRGDFLIQFSGFNIKILKYILKKLNKKLDIKVTLITKNYVSVPTWFKFNKYTYFYNKYVKYI